MKSTNPQHNKALLPSVIKKASYSKPASESRTQSPTPPDFLKHWRASRAPLPLITVMGPLDVALHNVFDLEDGLSTWKLCINLISHFYLLHGWTWIRFLVAESNFPKIAAKEGNYSLVT